MKKYLTLALSAFLASSAALAQTPEATEAEEIITPRIIEPASGSNNSEKKSQPVQNTNFDFLRLSSVIDAGELLDPGDLIQLNRPFYNWNLRCDVRLSKNKRACYVDQGAAYENVFVLWRIANNHENRPIAVINLPASFDQEKGLKLKFSGLEKTLGKEHFKCSDEMCVGGFIFEGFVQEAIINSKIVGFVIPVKNEQEPIEIGLAVIGFDEATNAAARDPFGRDITYAASAKQAKEKEAEAKAATAAAKAEAKTAQKKVQPKSVPIAKQNEARSNKTNAQKSSVLY
ncbi:hypothetical protein HBA92_21100 [Ochrobactrum sp. MR28]|nr:hypothetical protein [Ochrobactrum sp. MR28]MBX8818585.1 hypothetical protein [Ochrobactrum sp. MR31]